MNSGASYIPAIARELDLQEKQVAAAVALLNEGSTVPFIARYRKEVTGSIDEVAITSIRDRLRQMMELDERRATVLDSIGKQGKLTDDLKSKINAAPTLTALEDLYLPYKPKRRTRATIAKEKGLEPLAQFIFMQDPKADPRAQAQQYVSEEKKVATVDEALAGARDIIAEWINEDARARALIRDFYLAQGLFDSQLIKGKEETGAKFKDYFQWQEPLKGAPSHRVLAMRRGEKEEFLFLRVIADEAKAMGILREQFLKEPCACAAQMEMALEDGYKRLLSLSIETEVRMISKQKADEEAIRVFMDNLRQLLMAPPLGSRNVLAIDPGYRTGCKIAALDAQGKLLRHDVIYLHTPQQAQSAEATVKKLHALFNFACIAVGNGTAGREAESFARSLKLPQVQVVLVNESGASIYSASAAAREEFPNHDVTVRGSVSIGRRLQDPLAELVKIDPKSIGVGQYQHDVDQGKLKNSLDDVVISCVNQVGVEVNSASKQLLMYVSGLEPALAQAIVSYRDAQGAFASREEIKKVPKLGAKAFEQAGGFLRIRDAQNPLDASAVHPESYPVVEQMAGDLGVSVKELMGNEILRQKINLSKYVTAVIGLPTLLDIKEELAKPGRDPRSKFEAVEFKEGVCALEDLREGMELNGIVTNVTNFGCFVDIGVHQDGLVHVSEMADGFVKHPADVVKIAQKVKVRIVEVDLGRKRVSLTMRKQPRQEGMPKPAHKSSPAKTSGLKKPPEPPAPARKELYRW